MGEKEKDKPGLQEGDLVRMIRHSKLMSPEAFAPTMQALAKLSPEALVEMNESYRRLWEGSEEIADAIGTVGKYAPLVIQSLSYELGLSLVSESVAGFNYRRNPTNKIPKEQQERWQKRFHELMKAGLNRKQIAEALSAEFRVGYEAMQSRIRKYMNS